MLRPFVRVWLAFTLLATASAWSESVTDLHSSNYVNDFARVLSDTTVSGLNETCRQLDQKAQAQLAVVTINTLEGRDIESYAVDLFKRWGIGAKSTNRGVLILVAIQDHRYRIEVGYGLEPILPDGKVGGFGREAVPLLKENNYDAAIQLMTLRVAAVIAQDAGVELGGQLRPPPHQTGLSTLQFALLLLGILVLLGPFAGLIWLLGGGTRDGYRSRRWGGGWSGGGWSGGGFTGFGGGGGGFGGFGGGMSGGGGASGGW